MTAHTRNRLAGIVVLLGMAVQSAMAQKMYWTEAFADKIQRANLDGSLIEDVVASDLTWPYGIELNKAEGKIYWTDKVAEGLPGWIGSAELDGSNVAQLVTGLGNPLGMALDLGGGMMYWVDNVTHKIQRSKLDGTQIEDILTGGAVLPAPLSIALDIRSGHIYWTDLSLAESKFVIYRANLDGSEVSDMLDSGNYIALDPAAGKMYWAEVTPSRIRRANLDGSNVEDLVTVDPGFPIGVALDLVQQKLYWINRGVGKIQRSNLDGTAVVTLITGLVGPTDLALDVCGREGGMRHSDHAILVDCLTGPKSFTAGSCYCADLNGDAYIDLIDFAILQRTFTDSP